MYSAEALRPLFAAKLPQFPPEALDMLAEAVAEFSEEVAELEREACALLADANALVYEDAVKMNNGPQEETYAEQCCAEEARRIAYAIRNRKTGP